MERCGRVSKKGTKEEAIKVALTERSPRGVQREMDRVRMGAKSAGWVKIQGPSTAIWSAREPCILASGEGQADPSGVRHLLMTTTLLLCLTRACGLMCVTSLNSHNRLMQ